MKVCTAPNVASAAAGKSIANAMKARAIAAAGQKTHPRMVECLLPAWGSMATEVRGESSVIPPRVVNGSAALGGQASPEAL